MASSDNITVSRPGTTLLFAASTAGLSKTIPYDVASNTDCILVSNEGTTTAFVRTGSGTQGVTPSDIPVLAGRQLVIVKGQATDVGVILLSGTGNVFVTPCNGGL